MKGEAEAFAIEAKAKAEAEQMEKKANAWKEYQDAAVVDMILDVLPKVCILLHSFVMQVVLLLSALYASMINAAIILCVCPFITLMICVKMADIIELLCCMVWQPRILFFLYQTLQQNADRITLSLYVKYSCGI